MTTPTVTLRAPEVRTNTLQLREVETTMSGRFLAGRAVPYGEFAPIGWFEEEHAPGSFARSIKEAAAELPLLIWHDNRTWPVGVSHEWDDNDGGLDAVWRMDDADEARRAVDLAAKRMLTGLSIGFAPIRSDWTYLDDDEWDPEQGKLDRVTRRESRLLEVSLTPTPAFAGAKVSLVRSREQHETRSDQRGARRNVSPRLQEWRQIAEQLKR